MRSILSAGIGRALTAALLCTAGIRPAMAFQSDGMNAAEIRLALQKLSVLGSVLYVAAHPDDENTNLLAYLSKGRLVRTAYLSVTRGEGGQNLIGREQGEALGMIRTEELLAARRIDGAEQYFTRAIDFGYSKTSAEAISFWGEEAIVSDIVRVIRAFRPDVVITRFSPELGGHGQHTASAILTRRAFDLAGDPGYVPEGSPPAPAGGGTTGDERSESTPWRPKRLLFNGSLFMSSTFDTASALKLNTGGYNALLGESYNEISGRSRSMHKSQGFGAAQNRGDVINYFAHTAGDSARADILEGVQTGWSRVPGGGTVGKAIADAAARFDHEKPSAMLPALMKAYTALEALNPNPWKEVKLRELRTLILASAGVHAEALASSGTAAAGDSLRIRTTLINRSDYPFRLDRIRLPLAAGDSAPGVPLGNNTIVAMEFRTVVPPAEPVSAPYWLAREPAGNRYEIPDPRLLAAGDASRYRAELTLAAPDGAISLELPLLFKEIDPVEGERYRPFAVVPPISVIPEERALLFTTPAEKTLNVRLEGSASSAAGTLRIAAPSGWRVTPAEMPFRLRAGRSEERFAFTVAPLPGAAAGTFSVEADLGTGIVSTGTTSIRYAHIPERTIFPAARGKLVPADLRRKKFSVAYIDGSGDAVPEALRQIGYDVRLLTDEDLLSADLAHFQAIVAGVRAYNTRPVLALAQKRLMEYVRTGGTYVVQYATSGRLETPEPGPYRMTISRERVAEENAAVRFLAPEHPALSYPNVIGPEDFAGWVQERGLYFAGEWDSAYVPLLSMNDAGEPERRGALLAARYGDGYFCYTGLSFFRQLPAGVPGAYRLFTNLVELGSREKVSDRK